MIYILELREKLKVVYQRFGTYLNLLFKFIFGLAVFFTIKSALGFDAATSSVPVIIVMALACAFVPGGLFALICTGIVVLNIYRLSSVLALFVLMIILIMYFLVLRYTPKYGYVLVAMPVLLHWGMPYFMPIFLGVFSTPIAVIPVICGSVAYYTLRAVGDATQGSGSFNPDEALQIFKTVADKFKNDKEMILVTVVLAAVLLIVYILRRSKFNYNTEIATATGVVVSMIIFILSCIGMDLQMSIVKIIVFSLLGGALVYVAYFMKTVLDYSAVENVQFEDDDYYYYVKAVPKIKISAGVSKVKKISSVEEERSEDEEQEDNEVEGGFEQSEDAGNNENEYDDIEVAIDEFVTASTDDTREI